MRADANQIALRAIRAILASARPFELTVDGKAVKCAIGAGASVSWPDVEGLRREVDGPWPTEVVVECAWESGRTTLIASADYWKTTGKYRHLVGLRVRLKQRPRELVWITVPRHLRTAQDGSLAPLQASISMAKRKAEDAGAHSRAVNEELRELLSASGLPILSASNAEVGRVAVPEGTVDPNPEVAFRRLVHLALLKLDFFDRGERPPSEGRPLIDVDARLGEDAPGVDEPALTEESEEEEELESDDGNATRDARRYWAGGINWSGESKREQFLAGSYWQLGWSRDASDAAAVVAWRRFDQIRVGDWFAIKGYGARNQLRIHFIGEVVSIDAQFGRLNLQRANVALFHGQAPGGAGAGSFRDALLPITRADVVQVLFGTGAEVPSATSANLPPLPMNLILYGPPGTGKTYRLQSEYFPRFTRAAQEEREIDRLAKVADDLTWFQCIALALHQLGGKGKVDDILAHPVLKAKHTLAPATTPRQIVWGTLGQHTVESSVTVKMRRRLGELIFDKEADGTWKLAEELPAEVKAAAERLKTRAERNTTNDYEFVSFHQAYTYEDFVEGIRPRLSATEDGEDGDVAYELADGLFKKAVQAAIRLAGYPGTIDEFCRLSADERKRLLTGARPYALFVDEINRGNVARILGELITVLELDKRLGAEHELIVTLPYSRSRFGVPNNLHIIGTMNTADRSVEALDIALRRRFQFEELAPLPEAVNFTVEGQIDVQRMLDTINRRIERLLDRDRMIGHAFFIPLDDDRSLASLRAIFKTSILPLLQEYFFGDWGKIGLVLGKDFVRRRQSPGVELADFEHDDRESLAERATYELADVQQLTSASFRRIYEHVADD